MKLFSLKSAVLGAIVGSFLFVGSATAQNASREYRDWQIAQRRAQQEYQDYLRSRSRDDYRSWQRAQQEAQRQYMEYQQASRGYNNGYNNNGYYNNNGAGYYRVYRNGSYYQTDSRGAELLRAAVNNGYRQGYRQGQMDAQYRRGGNYYGNDVYRSGVYGYQSYVDRSQYQYYFQQGFQRGYEDGYNNQYRYGYRTNSGLNILGNILNGILNLSQQ